MRRLAVFMLIVVGVTLAKIQGVAVRGQLLCNGHPLPNVAIKTFDTDRIPGDDDDLLAEGYTGPTGVFFLNGTTDELTSIEPEIRIYTKCNHGDKPCKRKIVRLIPEQFIYSESTEHNVYNMGTFELSNSFENEEKACDGQV